MVNNVPFQSSVPATPSSATIVETIDQGGGVQRQRVSLGDILAGVTIPISSGTVSLSSASTNLVTPSSAVSVNFVGIPSVSVTSGTVTLSSNPTVIPSSAVQVTLTSNVVAVSSGTVTPSSAVTTTLSTAAGANTVTLSSNPTVIPSSAIQVTLTSNIVAVSSGTVTLSSNPTVILSSNPTVIASSAVQVTLTSNVVALSSVAAVSGDVANAVADSGNPLKIGGIYNSTNPTSVSSGQRVNAWFDKSGKMIVNAALRALKGVQLTAISCSTTETNITPTSTGGNFIDLYGLILSNQSSINVQAVTIKDSSGGTARGLFQVPANDTRGFMLPVDAAWPQAASSQAWTATAGNSSGSLQITALFVTNV